MISSTNPRRRPAKGDSNTHKTMPGLQRSSTDISPAHITPSFTRQSRSNFEDIAFADNLADSLSNLSLTSASSSQPQKAETVPRIFSPPTVDPLKADDKERTQGPRAYRAVVANSRPRQRRHSVSTDSGIGSDDSETESDNKTAGSKRASAIEGTNTLSARSEARFMHYVLRPLLSKPSLKAFRSIVMDVPRRISTNEIRCLRDLEKTLIFMAPERAPTAKLYLDFCLSSVACIKNTVQLIPERERIRSGERLYTNAYFSDLTEQIRQYAAHLAVSKAQIAAGQASTLLAHPYVYPSGYSSVSLDDSVSSLVIPSIIDTNSNPLRVPLLTPKPYFSTDEIKLYGGLSQNGRPAQLVRVTKDGKTISVETGELLEDENGPVSFQPPMRMKRSLSEQLADDEEIMRSMARRKKNPTPEELAPKKCMHPGCNKEFKRPCDLTKHSKTHQRRWKCPEIDCKYHTYGWPTEKERDRHINDRHSSAPAMFKCQFQPCPYSSKRESNCKQHMEKTHGWVYVRTKSNGKKVPETPAPGAISTPGPSGATNSPQSVQQTPQSIQQQTPHSMQQTPHLQTISTPSSAESAGIATPPTEPVKMLPIENSIEFPTYIPDNFFPALNGNYMNNIDGSIDESIMDVVGLDIPASTTLPELGATPASLESPADVPLDEADFALDDDIYTATVQLTPDAFDYAALLHQTMESPEFQMQLPYSQMWDPKMPQPRFELVSPTGQIPQPNTMLFTSPLGNEMYDNLMPVSTGQLDFQLFTNNMPINKESIPESLFDGISLPRFPSSQNATTSEPLYDASNQMEWSANLYDAE
ncbi:hypothetical protein TD95_004068 [Thielaviopsis punctulata]|uniref:C2H2-type domain-containing protein n=1 Tax=Thielaviopsis punctulata TaxID=72032 RepID=A0A0F4ZH16_9PEZI|nr:hypothetical protein TD95_004068 [Thielaviopsis punctulata]